MQWSMNEALHNELLLLNTLWWNFFDMLTWKRLVTQKLFLYQLNFVHPLLKAMLISHTRCPHKKSDDVGHGAIVTTQLYNPSAVRCQLTSLFPKLGCRMIEYVSRYTIIHANSTYIKHSISLKRSLDRPRTSTVLEHSYYFTDVSHVNLKIWGLNLICIDLHSKLKIALTSCPTTSVRNLILINDYSTSFLK